MSLAGVFAMDQCSFECWFFAFIKIKKEVRGCRQQGLSGRLKLSGT